jgi:hypothetical protein
VATRAGLLAGAAAGVGLLAGRAFVNTAAEFERFTAILEVLEGDAARARASMAWVQDFATRTPYELGQVTDAFVRLRGAGVDSRRFLESVGNAAAARGKSLDQAAEAFNDAITGEFERLKEFGITASRTGERVTLEYAVNGRQFRQTVMANNRAMVAETLNAIWNRQYPGAMARLSRTWDGMVSNLRDAWARWQLAVMDAGVFAFLQSRLEGVLATVNTMAANGQLQEWAVATSAALVRGFVAVEDFILGQRQVLEAGDGAGPVVIRTGSIFERLGNALRSAGEAFDALRARLEPIIGPFTALDAALVGVGVVLAGPLIGSLAALAAAVLALGAALVATPLGWAILAIGALAAAALLLWEHWDGVTAWFQAQWEGLPGPVQAAIAILTAPIRGLVALAQMLIDAWEPITAFFVGLGGGIERALNGAAEAAERLLNLLPSLPGGGQSPTGAVNDPAAQQRRRQNGATGGARPIPGFDPPRIEDLPAVMGQGVGPSSAVGGGGGRIDTGGTLRIRIEDGRVTGAGRMNDPRQQVDVDQGMLWRAA